MAVSNVSRTFGEDGEPREAHYEKSFRAFVETLEWYARVIGAAAAAERS